MWMQWLEVRLSGYQHNTIRRLRSPNILRSVLSSRCILIDSSDHFRVGGEIDVATSEENKSGKTAEKRAWTYSPIPRVLPSKTYYKVPKYHNKHIGYHRWKAHFGFPNTIIVFSRTHADPIAKVSCGSQSQELTHHNGEVEESDLLRPIVIRCCRKGLSLSKVQDQDARAAPRDNESGKINYGE